MDKYSGADTLENMSQARFYNKWTLGKFKSHIKGNILEVGCGIGNFTSILSEYGKVFAIDIDKSLIEKIKRNDKIEVGFGDIEKNVYFFKDQRFDTIVCINVLEHIKEDVNALENMYNLLQKGGKLILLVPTHSFLYGEIDKAIGHFRRYDPATITQNLSDIGFDIKFKRKLNLLGAIGWFIAGKILRNKQVEVEKIKLFNIISPLFFIMENFIEPLIGTSVLVIAEKP